MAPAGGEGTDADIEGDGSPDRGSGWREYNIEAYGVAEASALLILALDTTTRAGSAALLEAPPGADARLRHVICGDPARTHGERLPGEVIRLLDEAGASMDQVGLLAVIAGPGSFTGLRVGIATVQGLAMAGGLRIVAVPALEALAAAVEAPDPRHLIVPWMDAQRGEVFAAAYTADGAGQLQPPSSDSPARALARLLARPGMEPIVFVGDGALRYRDLIAAGLGSRAAIVDPTPPLAPVAARYAAAHADRAVLPHAVVPIYVRRPDAELAKDRRGRP